jgi:hypothetical protein
MQRFLTKYLEDWIICRTINIRMVSIIETSEHAAKRFLSTLAVLQLDAILAGAKNQKRHPPCALENDACTSQRAWQRVIFLI